MEWGRSARARLPLALVLLAPTEAEGIDGAASLDPDSLVERLAERVSSLIRNSDGLFRFDRDSVALLLPNTAAHGAVALARRVVAGIGSKPVFVKDRPLRLTCYSGVAWLERDRPDPSALADEAACALDAARGTGAGQVVVHAGGRVRRTGPVD
jgi:diguanylate cyclase (GGDEF)-like protein